MNTLSMGNRFALDRDLQADGLTLGYPTVLQLAEEDLTVSVDEFSHISVFDLVQMSLFSVWFSLFLGKNSTYHNVTTKKVFLLIAQIFCQLVCSQ